MGTQKRAARLTGYAHGLGLDGDVVYRPTNGVGWTYQWCPPDCAKTNGLGDSTREAKDALWSMAYWASRAKA